MNEILKKEIVSVSVCVCVCEKEIKERRDERSQKDNAQNVANNFHCKQEMRMNTNPSLRNGEIA